MAMGPSANNISSQPLHAAGLRTAAQGAALWIGIGERGPDVGDPGKFDQHGEAERPRSSDLFGGCARADDLGTHAGQPARRAAGLELEGRTDHPGNRRLIRAGSRTTRAPLTSTCRPVTTGRAAPLAERRRTSMNAETAILAFANAGNDLPREAMQWTLDHWDRVAPELLGILERFASGAERSDRPQVRSSSSSTLR